MECEAFFEGEGGDLVASAPVVIRITLLSKIKAYGFWVLPLLLLGWKPNRTRPALWIFAPYYAGMLVFGWMASWRWFGEIAGLATPLLATVCGLFLLVPLARRRNGWWSLAGAVVWSVLVHLVWIWVHRVEHGMYLAIVSAVLFLVVLVSALLVRLCCRRTFGRARLALWLLPVMVVVTLLGVAAMAIGFMLSFGETGIEIWQMLAGALVPALLVGLVLYVVVLTFLIVPFASAFYRERLGILLKLKLPDPRALPPAG